MKVDPLSIKVDQRKKDTRRDAWDRDYMGYYYLKEEPKSNKQISNGVSTNNVKSYNACNSGAASSIIPSMTIMGAGETVCVFGLRVCVA